MSTKQCLLHAMPTLAKMAVDLNGSVDPKSPPAGGCDFIIVKYGANNENIFNPWCPSSVLLDCIRKKCNCESNVTIDLIDLQGQVRDLPGKSTDYASGYLDGRQTYILIKVEKQEGDLPPKYTSLLNDMDQAHPDLQEKLNSLSEPRTKTPPKKSKWNTMKTKISVTRSLMSMRERSSMSRAGRNSTS